MTSVTLRKSTVRRLNAMRRLLKRNGISFSESRLFEELLRLYLRHWRGTGKKPAWLRRYNLDGKHYRIRPLYINRVLHAAATQRAMHTGESLSRMLDLAIRIYARRFLESVLGSHGRVPEPIRRIWHSRYLSRRLREPFFISYKGATPENQGASLAWSSRAEFIPRKGLNLHQVLDLIRTAA